MTQHPGRAQGRFRPAPSLAHGFADRILGIADGLLVFDAPPESFTEESAGWRLRTPGGSGS